MVAENEVSDTYLRLLELPARRLVGLQEWLRAAMLGLG